MMDCRVTILIKALNEERHIRQCLQSALSAIQYTGGEVILCDSGSNDGTVTIAKEFPVTIVQLQNFAERSCGLGVQLGFPLVSTPYLYVLDGDMEIDKHFLPAAIERLIANPRLAGVGGLVEELGGGNYEFEARKAANDGRQLGSQISLDMGGLYLFDVISKIGYLTNRNLHSYEEKELGVRIIKAGYSLERVSVPAIKHHGKTEDTAGLLLKRWRSKHLDGSGEWLRASIGTPQFWLVGRLFMRQLVVILSWLLLAAGMLVMSWSAALLGVGVLVQLLFFAWFLFRQGFGMRSLFGYVNIQISSAAMLRGFFRAQQNPASPIASRVLATAPQRQLNVAN